MTVPTPVLVEHRGPVAIVTLNRPDQLNALAPDQALPTLQARPCRRRGPGSGCNG